jgi:hypothetical protein
LLWQQGAAPGAALPESAWERENAARLRWLALALVAVGLAWRLYHYLLRFPIFNDEAMLLVNYFTRGYMEVLGPIDNCQVAPLLFHWVELTALRWLGQGELALRLPAFVACLACLPLFWRLARLTLPPLGHALAVGILSVSIWPATMGSLVKPYSGDLLFSLLLLNLAVSWLREPGRLRPLVVLACVIPVVVAASYPAVFIAGAVSVALLPAVRRGGDRKALALFALYNVLLGVTFMAHYLLVGRAHLASPMVTGAPTATTAAGMEKYWQAGGGFPPLEPVRFLKWFFLAHTGQMAAYPTGAANGGSSLTVLLALVGAWHLWRRGQRGLLVLAGGALGLGFAAALFHKYPFGSSGRIAQHLAPFYCLLAGLGVAVLVQRARTSASRWSATLAVGAVLALVGAGGIVRDYLRPYRDDDALWARQICDDLFRRAGQDRILLEQDYPGVLSTFHWQLGRRGAQVVERRNIDWAHLGEERSFWLFSYGGPTSWELEAWQDRLAQTGRRWRCVERTPSAIVQRRLDDPILLCRVYHWVQETDPTPSMARP